MIRRPSSGPRAARSRTEPGLPAARSGRLLIKTLWQDGARWLADAEYGSGPDHLERVDVTATMVGPQVAVTFVSGHGHLVTLKLVRADVLEGTQTVGGGYAVRVRLDRTR